MILETAQFTIAEGDEADFEPALLEARRAIARGTGFRSITVTKGIERPLVYQILVGWDSVEAHQAFRDSPGFAEWRRLINPFIDPAVVMEHWTIVADEFPG